MKTVTMCTFTIGRDQPARLMAVAHRLGKNRSELAREWFERLLAKYEAAPREHGAADVTVEAKARAGDGTQP